MTAVAETRRWAWPRRCLFAMEVEADGVGLESAGNNGLGSSVLPALAELLGGRLERGPARAGPDRLGTLCSLIVQVTKLPNAHQAL